MIADEWNNPKLKIKELEEKVFDEVNRAAFGYGSCDTACVETNRAGENFSYPCITYLNGCPKNQGDIIADDIGRGSIDDAFDDTLQRLLPIVRGRKIYWRRRPEIIGRVTAEIRVPGEIVETKGLYVDWFVRLRMAIEE